MPRRVVITGLGAVTPLGIGVDRNWEALCAGKSGTGPVTRFNAAPFRSRVAGEVKEFSPLDFMDRKQAHRTERVIQLAVAASRMALEDARLTIGAGNAGRTGVSVGTAMGGVESLDNAAHLVYEQKLRQISPFFIPNFIANTASGQLAILFGAKGPNMCSVTACASGTNSVGHAFRAIKFNEADIMLAGGTEAAICPVVFGGLDMMKAMSCHNDEPAKASRPFDKSRDGFVIGEGACFLILEEMQSALERGARIYAEVLGYGHNSDAYHLTAPDPAGEGATQCMKRALADAGMKPEQIDHINAHGTSTVLNDMSETRAIRTVFGERAKLVPVSANKSMTGHMWGASGSAEILYSALTIVHGVIPPTINYDTPDPECDLDYVPNAARKAVVNTVLSNSFGFGSTNATIILGRFTT